MSTSFDDIYCLNSIIKQDAEIQTLTTNNKYALYYLYLQFSISYFLADCYKNLSDITPFSQTEYNFISDGNDNQYFLTPEPINGSKLYVGYRENANLPFTEIPLSEYIYDSTTCILTLLNNPPLNYLIYVGAYIVGKFNADLIITEKTILAEGMNVPFDQGQLQKNSLLNMMVYGGTTKMYSQANHISELRNTTNNQYYNIVRGQINEYTYKYNPRHLKGLASGGGCG